VSVHTGSIRLKYRLGEATLFSVGFRVAILDRHFTELGTEPDATLRTLDWPPREADGVVLPSHPVAGPLPSLTRLPDAIRYVPNQYRRSFIDLKTTFDDYLGKFSGKTRSTLKRKVRKFAEHSGGELDWREYGTAAEMEEFHRLARELSQRTYQEKLLDAGLPDTEEFRAEMKARADRGEARGYLLFHEGTAVAYLYCPAAAGIFLYQFLGFDPEYAKWSPGTVLQYVVLERLFAEGSHRMFDFTEGQGEHKRFFSTGDVACADVWFLKPTLRNRFLLRLHRAVDGFGAAVGRILDRLGLKARLKRWLRRR